MADIVSVRAHRIGQSPTCEVGHAWVTCPSETGVADTPTACRPGACIVLVHVGWRRSRPWRASVNIGQLPVVRMSLVTGGLLLSGRAGLVISFAVRLMRKHYTATNSTHSQTLCYKLQSRWQQHWRQGSIRLTSLLCISYAWHTRCCKLRA
jgi:hypothetical protein